VNHPEAKAFMRKKSRQLQGKEKAHIWPSNYKRSFILAIELQYWKSLTIQLSKLIKFGHQALLMGDLIFIYNLVHTSYYNYYILSVHLI
jgi:hypothetical protein